VRSVRFVGRRQTAGRPRWLDESRSSWDESTSLRVSDRFDRIWEPRVGAAAAALLRKRARLGWGVVAFWAFIIGMAAATSTTTYNEIALPAVALYLSVYFLLLRNINGQIATAMSAHLGIPISTWSIPPMRSARFFDRAVEVRKGTRVARETSLFGGFFKIRRP